MVEGIKDIVDNNKVLTNVIGYDDWMSKAKVTGLRVIRVEVYFTIKTMTLVRDLIQVQLDFVQREGL